MKLVRQWDNPNKKTLIYILFISSHQQLSVQVVQTTVE